MGRILTVIKSTGARLLGPRRTGTLEQMFAPHRGVGWGGAVNGQQRRKEMMRQIIEATRPTVIYETGTYRGATAEWFGGLTPVPIHSVEANPRLAAFARRRLRRLKHVRVHEADSRELLRASVTAGSEPLFAYLDAHWNEDLPLAEEIEILFERRPGSVVVIDDFQIEGDPGYRYDDYGPGKALTRDYVTPLMRRFDLGAWYPDCRSGDETGVLRGCVVLAGDARWGAVLDGLLTTRRAPYGAGAAATP